MTKESCSIKKASVLSLISGMIILIIAMLNISYTGFIQDRMLSISVYFISGILVTLSSLNLLIKKESPKTFGIIIILFSSLSLIGFGLGPYFDQGMLVLILICVIFGVVGGLMALQIKK